jgi:hypothetical protein
MEQIIVRSSFRWREPDQSAQVPGVLKKAADGHAAGCLCLAV